MFWFRNPPWPRAMRFWKGWHWSRLWLGSILKFQKILSGWMWFNIWMLCAGGQRLVGHCPPWVTWCSLLCASGTNLMILVPAHFNHFMFQCFRYTMARCYFIRNTSSIHWQQDFMMFSMIANASLMSARWTHKYIYIHQFTPPIGMAVHPHSTVSALRTSQFLCPAWISIVIL